MEWSLDVARRAVLFAGRGRDATPGEPAQNPAKPGEPPVTEKARAEGSFFWTATSSLRLDHQEPQDNATPIA